MFRYSLKESKSVPGGRYSTLMMIFFSFLKYSLSTSTLTISQNSSILLKSGLSWKLMFSLMKIPTPPPDLVDLCISAKWYPGKPYRLQLCSVSQVSDTPIKEKLKSRLSRQVSKDDILALVLLIFIWHNGNAKFKGSGSYFFDRASEK